MTGREALVADREGPSSRPPPLAAETDGCAAGPVTVLYMVRDFCRDPYLFRPPLPGYIRAGLVEVKRITHSDLRHSSLPVKVDKANYLIWRWTGDDRMFIVPEDRREALTTLHLCREVLLAVGSLYLTSRTNGRTVTTSLHQLCSLLGLPPNGKNFAMIKTALGLLRSYTIVKQRIPSRLSRDGSILEAREEVFGFIERVSVVIKRAKNTNGRAKTSSRVEITLSEAWAQLLLLRGGRKNLLCRVPVQALISARNLPRRQVVPAKNLVFYLAGRGGKATLSLPTLVRVTGLRPRSPKEAGELVRSLLSALKEQGAVSWAEEHRAGRPLFALDLVFGPAPKAHSDQPCGHCGAAVALDQPSSA